MGFLRRWKAKHLLLAWGLYWIALVAIGLRGAIATVVRALNAPPGQGKIDASMADGILSLRVVSDARTWTGSASLTELALWFAGPPLLLWLLWLVTRRAPVPERDTERDYRIS